MRVNKEKYTNTNKLNNTMKNLKEILTLTGICLSFACGQQYTAPERLPFDRLGFFSVYIRVVVVGHELPEKNGFALAQPPDDF